MDTIAKQIVMTKKIYFCILFLFALVALHANNNTIARLANKIEKDSTIIQFSESIKAFSNIQPLVKNNWLVEYYIAFGNVQIAMLSDEKKQIIDFLHKSSTHIDIADSLSPNNSEILSVKAFIAQVTIKTNKLKALKMSRLADNYLDKALMINPNNPRAMFLKGQNLFYTPKAVGGGNKKALPFFIKARELFKNNTNFPKWGASQNLDQIKICSK